MKDFFLDYVIFNGQPTLLVGLWNTVNFSELSHWEVIVAGFFIGFIFRKFHKGEWGKNIANIGFLTIPALIISVLVFTLPNKTEADKAYFYSITADIEKMNADYKQWRDKNPKGTVNPEWRKERDSLSEERKKVAGEIIKKLTNQVFFILFLVLGFFQKKWNLREELSNVKDDIQTAYRKSNEKKNRIKQEIKNEELRIKRLEEKKLNLDLEKEKTKQVQAESSVKLKKLDIERPEKEQNLSKIIDKLDDL